MAIRVDRNVDGSFTLLIFGSEIKLSEQEFLELKARVNEAQVTLQVNGLPRRGFPGVASNVEVQTTCTCGKVLVSVERSPGVFFWEHEDGDLDCKQPTRSL